MNFMEIYGNKEQYNYVCVFAGFKKETVFTTACLACAYQGINYNKYSMQTAQDNVYRVGIQRSTRPEQCHRRLIADIEDMIWRAVYKYINRWHDLIVGGSHHGVLSNSPGEALKTSSGHVGF